MGCARGGGRRVRLRLQGAAAVRDRGALQRHVVGGLRGRRRRRRVFLGNTRGAAYRARRVRRVAPRQPQGPRRQGT